MIDDGNKSQRHLCETSFKLTSHISSGSSAGSRSCFGADTLQVLESLTHGALIGNGDYYARIDHKEVKIYQTQLVASRTRPTLASRGARRQSGGTNLNKWESPATVRRPIIVEKNREKNLTL